MACNTVLLRDVVDKLTGNKAVSGIADLDDLIQQTRLRLLQLYKLKSGHIDCDKPAEEVTDEWIDYLVKRYCLNDAYSVSMSNNVFQVRFNTHMAFRIKEKDTPFYVTAMSYNYDLHLDLVTLNSTVTAATIPDQKPQERHGIEAYAPRRVTDWGHPHASQHISQTHLLDGICYGDNYFPHEVHRGGMRLNEIVHYLDKVLAWIREISADDNYGKAILYKTRCKCLRDVHPKDYSDLNDIQHALITWEGMPRTKENVAHYAHYFACYAYQKIARSEIKTKDNILDAIGTDVAYGIGEYYPDDRLILDNPWYVETLYNCRKELEEVFYK
jgi:hypothetical protein